MKKITFFLVLVLGLLVTFSHDYAIAAFPDQPIKIIIPYRAGGASDLSARKIADIIQKEKLLPVPMVVVNMPGANTRTGLRHVQEASPDGYTLLLHHSTLLAMHTLGQIPMGFRDFDVLGQVMFLPISITAHSNAPWNNAKEMVEDLKNNPDKVITTAIPGLGTNSHVVFAYFLIKTGILKQIKPIYFSGGAECKTALIGEKVTMYPDPPMGSVSLVKAKDAKFLLFSDTLKHEEFANANNFADFNLPPLSQRISFFGPKGLPEEVRAKIVQALKIAAGTQEFAQFAASQVGTVEYLTEAECYNQFETDEKIYLELADVMKKELAAAAQSQTK